MPADEWTLGRRLAVAEEASARTTETSIQRCRTWCLVVGLIQTALYRGDQWWLGWTGVLAIATTTVWVQWALGAERREERLPLLGALFPRVRRASVHRDRAHGPLAVIGVVGMAGDAIATIIILGNLLSNPNDPIQLLPLILVLEAAVRWGPYGGVPAGVLGGGLSVAWSFAVTGRTHSSLPIAFSTFRVGLMVLVGLMLGNIVRQSRQQRRAAEAVFNASRDLVGTFDLDGTLRSVNPACEVILGYTPEELLGRDRSFLLDLDDRPFGPPDLERYRRGGAQMVELRIVHKDGRLVWVELDLLPDLEAGLIHMIGRDVSGRRRAESELRHRVDNDSLTGIWNRHALIAYLDRMLTKGYHPGLVFIDLDRFKDVNDHHGHVAGDRVLVEVAQRLCQAAGHDGSVARYAGDEFCIVVDDPDDVDDVVERTQAALSGPIGVGIGDLEVSASIGTAYSRAGDRAELLVDRADQAMYRRKDAQRSA